MPPRNDRALSIGDDEIVNIRRGQWKDLIAALEENAAEISRHHDEILVMKTQDAQSKVVTGLICSVFSSILTAAIVYLLHLK